MLTLPQIDKLRRLAKARKRQASRFDADQRAVSRLARPLERWWIATAERLQREVPLGLIARAVAENRPSLILDALPDDMGTPVEKQQQRPASVEEIERALAEAARAAYLDEQGRLKVELREDAVDFEAWALRNPEAIRWARAESAKLVTQVADSTKDAIRRAVTAAYESGIPTTEAAKNIRRSIGLLPRQSVALQRQIEQMQAQGKTSAQIERTSRATVNRMLRERSEMIARTEMVAAQDRGRQALWGAAIEDGSLPRNMRKRWDSGVEEPTCEHCLAMDGKEIGVGEEFDTPFGKMPGPPLHPHCRCGTRAVFLDDD